MKLKNKKTGEIFDTGNIMYPDGIGEFFGGFSSLAELNAEWEDYEEPKGFWYIDCFRILEGSKANFYDCELSLFTEEDIEKLKQIGNYFETQEEAEKAVEKLKAVKRLKDKGFRFNGWTIDDGLKISIRTNIDSDGVYDDGKKDLKADLDLLFGGEE